VDLQQGFRPHRYISSTSASQVRQVLGRQNLSRGGRLRPPNTARSGEAAYTPAGAGIYSAFQDIAQDRFSRRFVFPPIPIGVPAEAQLRFWSSLADAPREKTIGACSTARWGASTCPFRLKRPMVQGAWLASSRRELPAARDHLTRVVLHRRSRAALRRHSLEAPRGGPARGRGRPGQRSPVLLQRGRQRGCLSRARTRAWSAEEPGEPERSARAEAVYAKGAPPQPGTPDFGALHPRPRPT